MYSSEKSSSARNFNASGGTRVAQEPPQISGFLVSANSVLNVGVGSGGESAICCRLEPSTGGLRCDLRLRDSSAATRALICVRVAATSLSLAGPRNAKGAALRARILLCTTRISKFLYPRGGRNWTRKGGRGWKRIDIQVDWANHKPRRRILVACHRRRRQPVGFSLVCFLSRRWIKPAITPAAVVQSGESGLLNRLPPR